MTYYGVLTKHTDDKIESIESAMENSLEKAKPAVTKFLDAVRDSLWDDIKDYLIGDCGSNIRNTIKNECESIMEAFLLGDIEIINKTSILSEYHFRKLPAIRKAIFDACADDLQKTIIAGLQEENDQLKKDVKFYQERRY